MLERIFAAKTVKKSVESFIILNKLNKIYSPMDNVHRILKLFQSKYCEKIQKTKKTEEKIEISIFTNFLRTQVTININTYPNILFHPTIYSNFNQTFPFSSNL